MLQPTLWHSDRLVYRSPSFPADEAVLADFLSDPTVLLGIVPRTCKPINQKELEGFVKTSADASPGLAVFACLPLSPEEPTKAGEPIGWINLAEVGNFGGVHRSANFGLLISSKHSGKGYATECVEWLTELVFVSYGLHRLEANVFAWNTAALRVYEKCGFVIEGTRRGAFWLEGAWRDDHIIAQLDHEYRARHPEKFNRLQEDK